MKRREFTKLAGLSAVAVTTTGFIRSNGTSYVGDCETTTDILGPFYRPGSPVRSNLVIEGAPGDLVELSGVVRQKDCQTPFQNAKIELWHCSADEVYDNDSDEFRYRGTTYADRNGLYKFLTQMPVPYDAGGGNYRPAHFHLMITAKGYQNLITQIYFTGDPYLDKDSSSASPKAASRILSVQEAKGMKKVGFDVNLNDRLSVSPASLDKLVGVYVDSESGNKVEFFAVGEKLWRKNEVYGELLQYVDNNLFEYPGLPTGASATLKFDLQSDGGVKLITTIVRNNGAKQVQEMQKM